MNSITANHITLAIPMTAYWAEEHEGYPVKISLATTLTGALIVGLTEQVTLKWRPVTLKNVVATKREIDSMRELIYGNDALTLAWNTNEYTVCAGDKPAIEAMPIMFGVSDPNDTTMYTGQINLIAIKDS